MTKLKTILEELKQERNRISRAIDALEATTKSTGPRSTGLARKRRRLSAEGRARIAVAQRARWAKQKQAKKKET